MYGLVYLLCKYILLQIFDIALAFKNINTVKINHDDYILSVISLIIKSFFILAIILGYKHGYFMIGYKKLKKYNYLKDFLFNFVFLMGIVISCYNIHYYTNNLQVDEGIRNVSIGMFVALLLNFLFIISIRFII